MWKQKTYVMIFLDCGEMLPQNALSKSKAESSTYKYCNWEKVKSSSLYLFSTRALASSI